jgi:thioredoxin reductase (NADPH)
MTVTNVVIIGSGPAGLTAALYCSRGMLDPIVFTGDLKGGQLMNTTDVENFPGYPDGVQGSELINQLEFQAKKFGTKFIDENVINIDESSSPYKVTYSDFGDVKTIETYSVIIATGSSPLWLNAPGEQELKNKGISSCAVCDGAFFKDKVVCVIGGGDSAMEDALFLTKFCTEVHIIVRSSRIRASKIMHQRALENPKIYWKIGYTVDNWNSEDDKLESVSLKSSEDESILNLKCQGGFIAIGHKPQTDFLKNGSIKLDSDGYIETEQNNTQTSLPGIFACGDVTSSNKRYKQAITASGQGCSAALDCEKYLESIQ